MIEVAHHDRVVETVTDHTSDPADDATVTGQMETPQGTVYLVEKDVVMQEEAYTVRTEDAKGKESRAYSIKQNEDDEWYVDYLRKSPNRGHSMKIDGRNGDRELSTAAVRDALEDHGVELLN